MSSSIATPGDLLGVIEEFTPDVGAYEETGRVYSALVGEVVKDMDERRVSVLSAKQGPLMPRRGDVILGVVTGVRKDVAEVDVYQVEGLRPFTSPFKAVLHVSEVDVRFVDRILNALWPGDVVRAKVIAFKDPYPLSFKERGLGVLLAFCSGCRHPLLLKAGRLTCPACGSQEQRKVSSNYLLRWGRVEAKLIKSLV